MFATTEKSSVAVVSAMKELASIAIARAATDEKITAIVTILNRTDLLSALDQAIPQLETATRLIRAMVTEKDKRIRSRRIWQ